MDKWILFSLLGLSQLAFADTTEDFLQLSLEELMQVKVTASTKTEQTLLTAPASITIYTRSDIKSLGASSLSELVNYVPGFQSQRSSSGSIISSIIPRGYESGTPNRSVLILIDNQRVNSDWNQGSGVQYPLVPLENVERIEFIRGAGSALYGSNAFAAVISITTTTGKNSIAAEFSGHSEKVVLHGSTTFNQLKISAFFKAVEDKGLRYIDLVDTINIGQTTAKDPYSTQDAYLQLNYKNFSFLASHHQHELDDFYLVRRLADTNHRDNEQSTARLEYKTQITDTLSSDFNLSFFKKDRIVNITLAPAGGAFPEEPLIANANFQETSHSLEWFTSYKINDTDSLQLGIEYSNFEMEKTQVKYAYDIISEVPQTPFYNPDLYTFPLGKEDSRNVTGVYGQYQFKLLDAFNITLGGRYDNFSDFGSTFNPRLAMVYPMSEKTTLKVLYASAFRAPSRDELDLINNGLLLGNPNLDPETIDSYEIEIIHQFNQQHSLTANLYENRIDDLITVVTLPDGTDIRENSTEADYYGFEVVYIGQLSSRLTARGAISHSLSKPDFAFRTSDTTASVILNYRSSLLDISLSGYYHSPVENNDDGTLTSLPSYSIFNAKAAYYIHPKVNIYLQARNIFDKDFETPSQGSSFAIGVPNRDRQIAIGFDYSF